MAWVMIKTLLCVSLFKILLAQDLKEINENTNSFFDNLKKKYENLELTDEIKTLIDQEVDHYLNMVSRELYLSHSKKEFEDASSEITGTKVFRNTREIWNLNLPGAKDLCFFKKYIGYEQWFVAALFPSHLQLYLVNDNKLTLISSYFVENGLKVRSAKFSGSILLIVNKPQSITIFYFDLQGDRYFIQEAQNITIPNDVINDLSVLRTPDHLFLGVSTITDVHIYNWQDNNFIQMQILPYTGSRLTLFSLDRSTVKLLIISIISGRSTILEYSEFKHRFFPSQSISRNFLDVATIKPRSNDEFLLAASGSVRTIVYKYVKEDELFAPLQEIGPADRIIGITSGKTVLLALLKDRIVDFYQYDGWRFVRLSFRLAGVARLELVAFKGEEILLVKWFDDWWSFNRINWMKMKDPENMSRDLENWFVEILDKAKQVKKESVAFGITHRLQKLSEERMPKFKVNSVNGISVEKLKNLMDRYDRLESRIAAAKESFNKATLAGVLELPNLRVKTVRLNCTKGCSAEKLITKLKCDDLSKLRRIDDETLKFERVEVRDRLDGFLCPVPGVKVEKVNVKGLVNGISIEDFKNNLLRTSGDQVVTGEWTFEELKVDSLIASNFDVASTKTRQKFRTREIHARELNLTTGGMLLPLDGEPVTMIGKLELSGAVKLDGLVKLRGHVGGKTGKRIRPDAYFDDYQKLKGNYTLSNVLVDGVLATGDIVRRRGSGRSFKEIASKVIPLDAKVPVGLELTQNKTIWETIYVENFPKLLSKNRSKPVRVTGRKIVQKKVSLPDSIYSKLAVPTINANLCTVSAIASDIRTSTLTVGKATAITIEADDIIGATELHDTLTDSIASLNECDLSVKSFTGTVHVEKLNVSDLENSPFYSFRKAKFNWYRPDVIEGSVEVDNLKVGSLNVMQGIKIPFPPELDNLGVEGNLQVKKINGIDFDDFIKSTIKINDSVPFENITFAHLEVDEIEATDTNIELLGDTGNDVFLGNKIIDGDLEIEGDLSIPNILSFPAENDDVSYIVEGSIAFENEPYFENINGKHLNELFSKIWLKDRPTSLTGNFIFNNVALTQPFDAYESVNTPNFGSWISLENNLLSKTKSQTIEVPVDIKELTVKNVFTSKNSVLHSSDPYLNDLLNSSLKITKDQSIKEKWRIDQLIITGNMAVLGKINNLNLSTDVLRRGGDRNITGMKIVNEMLVKDLNGLGFDKWAEDVFMLNGKSKLITVTGKKTFDNFYARFLNVSGNVNGKKMDDLLLKTGDQTITGSKMIMGSIYAPSIAVRGLINDVNVTDLFNRQLKKHSPIQSVDSDVILKGNLRILGNMTVGGTFQGVELTKKNANKGGLTPLSKSAADLTFYASRIKATMKHRAKYWNKFEEVTEVPISANTKQPAGKSLNFPKLGNCAMTTTSQMACNEENRFVLKTYAKPEEILINEMLSIDDIPIVVQVSTGQKSRITIHLYNYVTDSFDIAANVRAPGILKASVSSLSGVVWIVTQLRAHMLVVRFEPWTELHKYHLPTTRFFALDFVPLTQELVFVRDDGMWKLDGLAGPRHVFPADLAADWIETFAAGRQFYVRLGRSNGTTLLRARYLGV